MDLFLRREGWLSATKKIFFWGGTKGSRSLFLKQYAFVSIVLSLFLKNLVGQQCFRGGHPCRPLAESQEGGRVCMICE